MNQRPIVQKKLQEFGEASPSLQLVAVATVTGGGVLMNSQFADMSNGVFLTLRGNYSLMSQKMLV